MHAAADAAAKAGNAGLEAIASPVGAMAETLEIFSDTVKGVSAPLMEQLKLRSPDAVTRQTMRLQANLRGWKTRQKMLQTERNDWATLDFSNVAQPKKLEKMATQAGGHPGCFKVTDDGTLAKETSRYEALFYERVHDTEISAFFPRYYSSEPVEPAPGQLTDNRMVNVRMQNLTFGCVRPCVMDIKVGIRTFCESEVSNTKLRTDLVEKMLKLAPDEVSEAQRTDGVTKLQYMQFRERLSSTSSFGWRIEALVGMPDAKAEDTKLLRTEEALRGCFDTFLQGRQRLRDAFAVRLRTLRETLYSSMLFGHFEMVGSSLLFVYDDDETSNFEPNLWMIDFAKSIDHSPLEPREVVAGVTRRTSAHEGLKLTHCDDWTLGNHEDGYLRGIDSLLELWER